MKNKTAEEQFEELAKAWSELKKEILKELGPLFMIPVKKLDKLVKYLKEYFKK